MPRWVRLETRWDNLSSRKQLVVERAWIGFLALGGLMICVYFLGAGGLVPTVLYEALGALSAVAIWVGIRIHRPEHPGPWLLLAGGTLLFFAGDAIYSFYMFALGVDVPWPSLADPVFLVGYVLIVGGLLRMVRIRSNGHDRAGLLDSLVVSTALGSLLWIMTVSPYATDPSLTGLEKIVSMSYPLSDLVLLAVVIRLLLSMGRRTPANLLLASGFVLLFVADVFYAVQSLTGTYLGSGGLTTDGFWLASYALTGAAALHPSMARMFEPVPGAKAAVTRTRMVVVVGSFLFIPLLLGIQSLLGQDLQVGVVVIASATLTILLFARVEGLMKDIRSKVTQLETQQVTLEASLTEREELAEQLHYQAFHDPLTGIANRDLFLDRLRHWMSRRKEGQSAALIFLDLDDFKSINDGYSHETGDSVLRQTAARLRDALRPEDTVGRFGGDEFVILVEDSAPIAAECVARRLLAVVGEPLEIEGVLLTIHASVGIALEEGETDPSEFLHKADLAMYKAKAAGKSRYAFSDPMDSKKAIRKRLISTELPVALAADRIAIHYQPIVDLATGKIEGVEALSRWHHSDLGMVPPLEFIPVVEESDMILKFDLHVIDRAIRQLAQWSQNDPRMSELKMSVNLSTRSLEDPNLTAGFADLLNDSGIPGRRVVVEVTETSILKAHLIEQVWSLKSLGVRIALDDFGTGYSSLAHLRDLPVDILKIDRSFVQDLPEARTEELIAAIYEMAGRFSIAIVAEGIEEPAQLRSLQKAGRGSGQGFLLARPAPAEKMLPILTEGSLPIERLVAMSPELLG